MKRICNKMNCLLLILILFSQTAFATALTITPTLPDLNLPSVFISKHEVIKAVPIYRAYTNMAEKYYYDGLHMYTANQGEFTEWLNSDSILNQSDDGIAAYISPVPLPYTVPLWNMKKSNLGLKQYFVTSEADRDNVINKYGYANGGIMGYVVSLNDILHGNAQMFQFYRPSTKYSVDDHYYSTIDGNHSGYDYNGVQFRVWNNPETLQEVNVHYPNGGETLAGGSTIDIKWSTLIPGGNISLYYTLNPEEGWAMIAENLVNTGSYSWTVPNSATGNAVVEARWTFEGLDANCFDQSDKYFSIKTGAGEEIKWTLKFNPLLISALLDPAAPTNLSAGSNFIQNLPLLYWKDNAFNETAYVIERKLSGGTYAKLAQVGANQTQYKDNSAEAGKTYVYRVKAMNGTNSSGYSNEASVKVFASIDFTLPPIGNNPVIMMFTLNKNTYSVNGTSQTMDVSPVSIEGRTMLPVRFVGDPLGAVSMWDGTERKVTVTLDSTKIELWIGSSTALINGISTQIDPDNPNVKPLIINSRTMVPMRFITEKLGCGVEWMPATSQVKVDYPQ